MLTRQKPLPLLVDTAPQRQLFDPDTNTSRSSFSTNPSSKPVTRQSSLGSWDFVHSGEDSPLTTSVPSIQVSSIQSDDSRDNSDLFEAPSECATCVSVGDAVSLAWKRAEFSTSPPRDQSLEDSDRARVPFPENEKDPHVSNMASLNPNSAYRLTGQRSVTQEQAKEQQKIIEQKLRRAGQESPPYDFVDLIGKGSFGRVYLG